MHEKNIHLKASGYGNKYFKIKKKVFKRRFFSIYQIIFKDQQKSKKFIFKNILKNFEGHSLKTYRFKSFIL